MSVLSSLGVTESSDFYYYHPDEEAEVRGIDYVALNVSLTFQCKKFRSLVYVAQIIQSLTALYDGTSGVAYQCNIHDPIPLDPDDGHDKNPS